MRCAARSDPDDITAAVSRGVCLDDDASPLVDIGPVLPSATHTRALRHYESFFANELRRHVTNFHDYHGPVIHLPAEKTAFTIDDVSLYRTLGTSQEKITDLLIQALRQQQRQSSVSSSSLPPAQERENTELHKR